MIWTYVIIAVLLLAAELLYFRLADKFNIIDKPNERSSHKKIVLRGGGVIFLVGAWLYAAFFGLEYWPFLLGLTLVSVVSFLDDLHPMRYWERMLFQFAAMALVFISLGVMTWEYWWMVLPGLILCVGVANAFNFMDGINGITGGYTLAVLLPLAWLNEQWGFVDQRLIIVVLLADLVFCFFNFRPRGKEKCFAGDVGSVGVAFVVVFILGRLILHTGDITYIVFLVLYGVDTMLTIGHRLLLHEKLSIAHRKHVYQLMANELGIEHTVVSSVYMALQLAISVGMILIPNTPAWHWGYFAGVAMVLAVAYVLFMKKYYHLHEEYLEGLRRGK